MNRKTIKKIALTVLPGLPGGQTVKALITPKYRINAMLTAFPDFVKGYALYTLATMPASNREYFLPAIIAGYLMATGINEALYRFHYRAGISLVSSRKELMQ